MVSEVGSKLPNYLNGCLLNPPPPPPPPPVIDTLDLAKPEEWPRWIRHFKVSNLASKTEAPSKHFSVLRKRQGGNLLQSFNLTGDARDLDITIFGIYAASYIVLN